MFEIETLKCFRGDYRIYLLNDDNIFNYDLHIRLVLQHMFCFKHHSHIADRLFQVQNFQFLLDITFSYVVLLKGILCLKL